MAPRPSTSTQRLILRIQNQNTGQFIDVGIESEEEMKEWAKAIGDAANERKNHKNAQKNIQKKFKIARNLSDLIFYSQSVTFRSFDDSRTAPFQVMSSFTERKAVGVSGFFFFFGRAALPLGAGAHPSA